jgi:hypothetical protein
MGPHPIINSPYRGGFHVPETAYTKTGEKASAKSYDLLPNEQVINLEVIAYEYDNRDNIFFYYQ